MMTANTVTMFNLTMPMNSSSMLATNRWNASQRPTRQLFPPTVAWSINALYVIISLADFFGNSLVCILSYKEKKMRTQFNMLLLNLSLADIASGIMIYPYIWLDFANITDIGKKAGFLCAISVGLTLFLTCTLTNMFTLCAITIVRYLNIVKRYRTQFIVSDKFIKGYCIFTWIAGIVIVIPNAWSFKYNTSERVCYRQWPSPLNGKVYSLVTSAIGMVMPVITMISFYIALVKHIWSRSKQDPATNIAAVRAWKNIAALLGGLILAYLICWFPFYATWVAGRVFRYFTDDADGEYERQRYLRVAMMFALLNSALDPLIYAYRSSEYRTGFKKILGLRGKPSRPRISNTLSKMRTFSYLVTTSTSNLSGQNVCK